MRSFRFVGLSVFALLVVNGSAFAEGDATKGAADLGSTSLRTSPASPPPKRILGPSASDERRPDHICRVENPGVVTTVAGEDIINVPTFERVDLVVLRDPPDRTGRILLG